MFTRHAVCPLLLAATQKVGQKCLISSSATLCAIRPKPPPDRLKVNANQLKELRDAADYTFLDGRPTPYGGNHLRRIRLQMAYAEKIVKYSKELDSVKEEWKVLRQAEQDAIQDRIKQKLKPKGSNHPQALENKLK